MYHSVVLGIVLLGSVASDILHILYLDVGNANLFASVDHPAAEGLQNRNCHLARFCLSWRKGVEDLQGVHTIAIGCDFAIGGA
jgi:hypothetical protein